MGNNRLHIDFSKRTPMVFFEEGKMFIIGRSIIENPSDFYNPVFSFLSQYITDYQRGIDFYFAFEHINTGSVKWLFVLLKELLKSHNITHKTSINWYYEKDDDDLQELGYIFRSLVPCKFSITEVDAVNEEICDMVFGKNRQM